MILAESCIASHADGSGQMSAPGLASHAYLASVARNHHHLSVRSAMDEARSGIDTCKQARRSVSVGSTCWGRQVALLDAAAGVD